MDRVLWAIVAVVVMGAFFYVERLHERYTEALETIAQKDQIISAANQAIEQMGEERRRVDALLVAWGNEKAAVQQAAEERERNVQAIRASDEAARAWLDMPIPDSVRRVFAKSADGVPSREVGAAGGVGGADTHPSGK